MTTQDNDKQDDRFKDEERRLSPFFRFFAERHTLANLVTLMTILLGLVALLTIRREINPTVDFGEMFITTRYRGASPEDVELNVTNKIEEELKEVDGIERMASTSMENISVIDVVIDPDARDKDDIKTEIREAVSRVTELPAEVTEAPYIEELDTTIFPVIEVGLSGELPYRELREVAKGFEKKLELVHGVSSVEKYGYLDREVRVEVDPDSIHDYQVPLRQIIRAVQGRNIRSTGGTFESYTSERNVVTLAQFSDPVEVGDVIVRSTFEGPVVKVSDLAIIRDDFEDERILSRMNGRAAISFLINKKESADAIRTVDAIKKLVEEESETLREKGVKVQFSSDFSRYVRNSMSVVKWNGLIGLVLVIIFLSVFLNLRTAFWVAMGIPVALLGTIFLMPFFGVHLNMTSLGAMIMIIGIIVDDGIIIAENIYRHLERGFPPLKAAIHGIQEVFGPVLATVLTTFAAFAPMFFMTGIMGKFVFAIPLVIGLALLISLFEAIVALPAHITMGLRHNPKKPDGPPRRSWFDRVRARYKGFMSYVLKFRYVLVLLFIVVLAGVLLYAGSFMKFELFPASAADSFHILVELPTGSSLHATSDRVKVIEGLVENLPKRELASFVTRVGNKSYFAAGENENWAIITVDLTPFGKRPRSADEIVEELRQKTDKLVGYERITYIVEGGGPPVGRPITIRVVGSDDDKRKKLAGSVEDFLGTVEGVKDIDRDDKLGKDQVEVKIDYEKLSRRGLTVADVAQNVRIAYDGEVVTSVRYGDEDVDFRVLLQEHARKRPDLLSELLIPNQEGRLVALKEIAELHTGPGPSNFYHFDGERAVTVTADITKGTTTPLEATTAVQEHFDLGRDWPGMRFVIGGEAEETQESMASLKRAFMISAVAIYFLLVLLFNSAGQPLMVMLAIPFGIIGVIVAFVLHGQPLGFLAMMGLIGLSGVVVNDSLVLVSHINELRTERPGEGILKLVAEGCSNRLRAVLLTTFTTVAGVLPLAYGVGGSDPIMAPMALALGYGLLFATPLTLILVPSIYVIGYDFGRLFRRLRKRAEP